jgi:hypothetical protein
MSTDHRWRFFDPVQVSTYEVQINPNEGGSPNWRKNITSDAPLGPGGRPILTEGPDEVQRLECSGVILDQAHYTGLVNLFKKRRQVRLTDDLGRQFWVYIESFEPTRQRSRRAWRHTYRLSMIVMSP